MNLTPANILYTGLLASVFNAPRSGLTVLDPYETTVDRRSRQYFFHLKDQHSFQQGLVLEVGYARNRTFGREIPQGPEIYVLTPDGRQGNFFVDAQRWGQRDQWLTNAILPAFDLAGSHQLKIGSDANWLEYRQDVQRTGFERRRLDGTLRRRVTFGGDGSFRRRNTEFAWHLQDTWKARPNLLLEIGVRQDRDSIVGDLTTSPRFAFSVSSGDGGNPSPSGEEKVVVVWSRAEVPTRRAHKVRSEGALGVDTEVSKESIARAIGDSCARPDPTDRDRARVAHHFGQSGTRPRPRIFVVSPASGYQHDRTVVERDQLTSASSGVSPPAEAVLGPTFLGTGVPGGQLRRPHG